ncbi:MAG: DUF1287 domain-containing protein [Clostridia bacterium]|nr:DUF1287 domain-containing protein [Clostridia bacterium]
MKKALKIFIPIVLLLTLVYFTLNYFNLIPKKYYTARDFGIETVKSSVDFNQNGVDDYTDILLGARKDAQNHPKYDGKYIDGGYPPDNIGVCTDVVWRGFKNAGYSLKDMVDRDIENRREAYSRIDKPDTNIDFRRVKNLNIFFKEYAISLTTDITQIAEWQPGDIVIFNNQAHIGIVSDKRNRDGMPYIIHNGGQPNREEDYLTRSTVVAHYRFDASKIDSGVLAAWEN